MRFTDKIKLIWERCELPVYLAVMIVMALIFAYNAPNTPIQLGVFEKKEMWGSTGGRDYRTVKYVLETDSKGNVWEEPMMGIENNPDIDATALYHNAQPIIEPVFRPYSKLSLTGRIAITLLSVMVAFSLTLMHRSQKGKGSLE